MVRELIKSMGSASLASVYENEKWDLVSYSDSHWVGNLESIYLSYSDVMEIKGTARLT
jgi:hypothetical protein